MIADEHNPIMMMLTNSGNPRDIELAAKPGANGFQTKPMRREAYLTCFNERTGMGGYA